MKANGPFSMNTGRLALVTAAMVLLSGCAIVYSSQVSKPDARALGSSSAFGRSKARSDYGYVVPISGAHGGIEMRRGGLKVQLHVLNRKDRAILFGPWLIIPLPLIPVVWNPGASDEIESLMNTQRSDPATTITIFLAVAPTDASDGRTISLVPDSLGLAKADGTSFRVVRTHLVGGGRNNTRTQDGGWSFTGPAQFELVAGGSLSVKDSFVVTVPEIRFADERIAFPPIRYSHGNGTVLTMVTIN